MAEAPDFPGMAPSAARQRLRRATILLVGAPLLAGLLQLPTGPSAQAAPVTAKASNGTVDVSVDSFSPSVPTEADTLTISGKITNEGKQPVTAAEATLRVGPVMTGRRAIDQAMKNSDSLQQITGNEVDGKYVEEFDKLVPGVSQRFSLSIPVDELDLNSAGVYQLGVTLSGRTGGQQYDQILGIERTVLPWQPSDASEKTKTTFLWPLISRTHLTAETGPGEQQAPVFSDDTLAKEISPGGRLEQLLSLGRDLPVTWVIDPDLLASVDAMRESYQVMGPDGTPVAGKNQAVAKQWLNNLEEAVQDKEVVALPFADPDLASLAHQGKRVSGSLSHLQDATDAAAKTVQTVLHVDPSTDFSWPAEGAVDPSIVDVATSAGARTVIARSDSLRETRGLRYTPTAARPIGGGTTAVVADARLSTAFQGDMTTAQNSTRAVQRFLAQSHMINLQAPKKQRSVVVAPQRMPSVSQAQSMAKALRALDDSAWSQADDLVSAAEAKPDPDATTQVPSTRSYPSALRKQELPEDAFLAIRSTKKILDKFKVILSRPERVVTPFGRAIDREMSTSWRGQAKEAERYRAGVQGYLDGLTQQVKLIEKSEAKLSGRSATIPVTVQNNLVQGVEDLRLRLTSTKPTRLKISDGPYDEQPIKVSGEHSQSVKFTTQANANGPVPVVAQLYTADGEPYGPEIRFDVRVTQVPPAVMLVIAGGVLLLVLAGFRMYTQRKRAAALQAADDADRDDEDGGNTAPDTAPESTDPSGTGERVDR
ncbi:DUF6049 family protein [Streptomyces apocyni]|uniref:DUF6049 family protein n=1 Tax=Streptomyces apocyni TaxID=2654677 RepID=UPI0012EA1978|nr:DUF6049 family protein [Streptomyces apocyni]